jgi:hypothetical protein
MNSWTLNLTNPETPSGSVTNTKASLTDNTDATCVGVTANGAVSIVFPDFVSINYFITGRTAGSVDLSVTVYYKVPDTGALAWLADITITKNSGPNKITVAVPAGNIVTTTLTFVEASNGAFRLGTFVAYSPTTLSVALTPAQNSSVASAPNVNIAFNDHMELSATLQMYDDQGFQIPYGAVGTLSTDKSVLKFVTGSTNPPLRLGRAYTVVIPAGALTSYSIAGTPSWPASTTNWTFYVRGEAAARAAQTALYQRVTQ